MIDDFILKTAKITDGLLEPYVTERFRRNPHNVGYNICLAVDAVQPVLEEALFQFAFEAYERVGRMKLENSWEKKVAEEINEEVAAKRVV